MSVGKMHRAIEEAFAPASCQAIELEREPTGSAVRVAPSYWGKIAQGGNLSYGCRSRRVVGRRNDIEVPRTGEVKRLLPRVPKAFVFTIHIVVPGISVFGRVEH